MKITSAADSIWSRTAEQVFFPDESNVGSLPCEKCYLDKGDIVRSDNSIHNSDDPLYSGHEAVPMGPMGRMM